MSIQRRLLFGLLTGLIGLYVAASLTMYFSGRMFLERQLDATLAARARTLGSSIRLMPDGQLALEPFPAQDTWNGAAGGADIYQVWAEDGSVLLRSPSLGHADLSRGVLAGTPTFADTVLPDGIAARMVTFRLAPTPEDEDEAAPQAGTLKIPQAPVKNVVVAVAQDNREIGLFLGILLWAAVLIAVFASCGTVVLVQVVVRRGLQPLQQVAAEAAQIDERSLHVRFSVDDLPRELQPICLRLNVSLQRLQQAFERERRFTADVAHELRTPIAELRALADVALRGDGDAAASAVYFQDARGIALQMERIVNTLLALARCHAGMIVVVREAVDVGGMFREMWQANRSTALARAVAASFEIPRNVVVGSDRTMLQSILGNLLGNAAEYAQTGGTVACKAEIDGQMLRIRVVNPVERLTQGDVEHFFEPFWRKDISRTDGSHSGLGLTLVRAYAEILGGETTASLLQENSLCVGVDLPVGDEEGEPYQNISGS